jgi:hypothetical protein
VDIREEINRALETLPAEILEGVLEYIRFAMDSPLAEPTEDELKAIRRGREEFARVDYACWEDMRGK